MLVLSRRGGEAIVIGGDVKVTVLEVRGDLVRLGIEAPRSISVHRLEVHEELVRMNQDATGVSPSDLPRLPRPDAG